MTEHKDSATATDGAIDWIAEVGEPSVFYIQGESVRIEEIMNRASVFPDLLAALDSLVANYGDKYLNEGSWSQARAALAKAKN